MEYVLTSIDQSKNMFLARSKFLLKVIIMVVEGVLAVGGVPLFVENHGESLWRRVPIQLSAGKYIFTFGSTFSACQRSEKRMECVTLCILKLYPFTLKLFQSRLLYKYIFVTQNRCLSRSPYPLSRLC